MDLIHEKSVTDAAFRNAIRVSLIIPTYGRETLLVETLKCALAQKRDDYEIVVVDQTRSHEPETERFLRQHVAGIRYIMLEEPSLTQARNVGIRASRGEVLVFVDDDTAFGPDFLTHHLEAHGAGTGAVLGRVIESQGREQRHPLRLNSWIKFTGGINCPDEGKTNTVTGCNFSLTREAIGEVGLFDTRYVGVAVREESDYALRLVRSGYAIHYSPAARLIHHRAEKGGVGVGGDTLFFDNLYYFNEFLFAKKHFSRPAVWLYRLRLKRRGAKALKRLIRAAEAQVDRTLSDA